MKTRLEILERLAEQSRQSYRQMDINQMNLKLLAYGKELPANYEPLARIDPRLWIELVKEKHKNRV